MEVIINTNNSITNENTMTFLFNFITSLCDKLQFSSENIYKIIFVDEDNFGKEIKNIDQDEDYTNTEEIKCFGKTIYIKNIDKSVIIIRVEILQLLIKIQNENSIDYFENQLPIFTILHEIGHCINHYKQKNSIINGAKTLNINEIPYHYFSIIIDEFNANNNIKELIQKEWVIYELKSYIIADLIQLGKNILNFRDIIFVQNIWNFYKRFMDIGVFLINYNNTEYITYLNEIELPFDINNLIKYFSFFNKGDITEEELFKSLLLIQENILYKYYKMIV